MINNIKESIIANIEIYQQYPLKIITLIVDIAIVIFVAYHILKIFKESRAWQLIKGIIYSLFVKSKFNFES